MERFTEILPLAHIVTQFTGQQTSLQQAIQLHAHLIAAVAGTAAQISLIADGDDSVAGEVIHRSGHFRIDERHIAVGSRVLQTVFVFFQVFCQCGDQRLVDILTALLAGDQPVYVCTKTLDTTAVKAGLRLTDRQYHKVVDVVSTPLGIRIKITHGIQLVTKEFGTDRPVGSGGVDIQNATANSKLTGSLDHGASRVTGRGQTGKQFVNRIFLTHFQTECSTKQGGGGHGPLAERFPCENLEWCSAGCQIEQLAQALLLPCTGDHSSIIQGQLSAGQNRRCVA